MLLIVGLGNPGTRYAHTRHNVGFRVVDDLNQQLGTGNWGETSSIFHAQISELNLNGHRLVLAKPQTYMNASGDAVQMIRKYHQFDEIWVIYDEVELPFGQVRVKHDGSSGGHKGIESIDNAIGPEYWRIRVGVGREQGHKELADYVLSPFNEDEQKLLPIVIDQITEKLVKYIDETIRVETFDAKKEPTEKK